MYRETLIPALGVLVAFVGWFLRMVYDDIMARPKITGTIRTVLVGKSQLDRTDRTSFLVYAFLVNKRRAPVAIWDYELELNSGNGFERVARVYGEVPNLTFTTNSGKNIDLKLRENMICRRNTTSQFGVPTEGFVLFAGDPSLKEKRIKRYRLTCVDAFGKRHLIVRDGGTTELELIALTERLNVDIPISEIAVKR